MSNQSDFLSQEYTIETPENVVFNYRIAGIGSRFIGALIDLSILILVLSAVTLMLYVILGLFGVSSIELFRFDQDVDWRVGAFLAIYFLVTFVVWWGYFSLFELFWNGQTPGKRAAKTRVIQSSGGPVSPLSVFIRNLVRIIDWLPWNYLIGFITMMLNDQSRRLGDFAADTIVVHVQHDEKDIFTAASSTPMSIKRQIARLSAEEIRRLYETYPHIARLTPTEYELLEEVTFGPLTWGLGPTVRPRLAKILSPKVGGPLPEPLGSNIEATRILTEIALLYNIHHANSIDNATDKE
ncbi:MAG: RDD family protein [Chloroflexi bacterium]|nr:RDD family protein [Chloroflexota bacterium]